MGRTWTTSPAEAGCTVRFRDTNDWGNGFVGAYSGPNVLPATFTLNGIVCSTS